MVLLIGWIKLFKFVHGVYNTRGSIAAAYYATMHFGKTYFARMAADAGVEATMALMVAEGFDPTVRRAVAGGVAY